MTVPEVYVSRDGQLVRIAVPGRATIELGSAVARRIANAMIDACDAISPENVPPSGKQQVDGATEGDA